MAVQNQNVPPSFLDDLKWVRCTFCYKPFSRDQRFFVLSCKKVACINCAMPMRSTTTRFKLDCKICKSPADFCEIREQMVPNVRQLLELPWKAYQQAVCSHNFQKRMMNWNKKSLVLSRSQLVQNGNDALHRWTENKKQIETARGSITTYRTQLLKVMPEERLRQMCELTKKQLEEMPVSDMIISSRSRRSDGRTGTLSSHQSHSHSHSRSKSNRSNQSDPRNQNESFARRYSPDAFEPPRPQPIHRRMSRDNRRSSREQRRISREQRRISREQRRTSRDQRY